MFTLEQIKAAHAKVKSGKDFPSYISELKALGVLTYDHYLSDGHIRYTGPGDMTIAAEPKWAARPVTDAGSAGLLQQALTIHQQGATDYPLFCLQAAEAGVEQWTVDIPAMTCTYYDKSGNALLAEAIPEV